MAKRSDFHKVIVGRSELLHFMDGGIEDIPAKVDTGAYRSAVHASDIELSDDGKQLTFTLLGNHPVCGVLAHKITTDQFTKVWVSNSFGQREERFEVKLRVKLGPKIFTAAFSLADRSKKIYPILIGRKMINGRFLVDTSLSSVDRIELKKTYGIEMPNDEEEGR